MAYEHEETKNADFDELIEKTDTAILDKASAECVKEWLRHCRNDKELRVIALRFGLEDGRRKTLQEVANIMGTSRDRVRMIESNVLHRGNEKSVFAASYDRMMKQLKQD